MAQLQDLFQTHAIVQILDFLTLYKDFEYTRTDIANETGISRRTLYQVWPILEQFNLVELTKSSGMVKFYKLNTRNPISQNLIALADTISIFSAQKLAGTIVPQDGLKGAKMPLGEKEAPLEATLKVFKIKGTPSQIKDLVQTVGLQEREEKSIPIEASTMSEESEIIAKALTSIQGSNKFGDQK
jgi:hypothetical protein